MPWPLRPQKVQCCFCPHQQPRAVDWIKSIEKLSATKFRIHANKPDALALLRLGPCYGQVGATARCREELLDLVEITEIDARGKLSLSPVDESAEGAEAPAADAGSDSDEA